MRHLLSELRAILLPYAHAMAMTYAGAAAIGLLALVVGLAAAVHVREVLPRPASAPVASQANPAISLPPVSAVAEEAPPARLPNPPGPEAGPGEPAQSIAIWPEGIGDQTVETTVADADVGGQVAEVDGGGQVAAGGSPIALAEASAGGTTAVEPTPEEDQPADEAAAPDTNVEELLATVSARAEPVVVKMPTPAPASTAVPRSRSAGAAVHAPGPALADQAAAGVEVEVLAAREPSARPTAASASSEPPEARSVPASGRVAENKPQSSPNRASDVSSRGQSTSSGKPEIRASTDLTPSNGSAGSDKASSGATSAQSNGASRDSHARNGAGPPSASNSAKKSAR